MTKHRFTVRQLEDEALRRARSARVLARAAYHPLAELDGRMIAAALDETLEAVELLESLKKRLRGNKKKRLISAAMMALSDTMIIMEDDLADLAVPAVTVTN